MTDKINFGKGLGPINPLNGRRTTVDSKSKEDQEGADRVDFSSVLQEVNKVKKTSAPVDTERVRRLEELKAQIADGSYRPDLEKVAASLLDFIAKGK